MNRTGSSASQEISIQLKNDDLHSEINITVEKDKSTDPKNIICIFCDQKMKKHLSKRLLFFQSIKKLSMKNRSTE